MEDREMLKSICDDIYDITGIKAVIYDANKHVVYSHPHTMGTFCSEIRKHPHACKKCLECDEYAFSECGKTGGISVYNCHVGLTEAVAPIYDNGIIVGYIMFGQMLNEAQRESVKKCVQGMGLSNEKVLLKALEGMESTKENVIYASARLISMCASYVRLKDVLKVRRESLGAKIEEYIYNNLADTELSIKKICKKFAISRGTLYNISKQAFGMGITEYVKHLRLNKAIRLIKESDTAMYRIAEDVGIPDANYLTKLVKISTGKTPRLLRKQEE